MREGEAILNSVRSRSAKALVHAFAAAAASLYLASCSTTAPDGQASFALTNPEMTEASTDTATPAPAGDEAVAGATTPDATAKEPLPAKVAYMPAAKPGTPFPKDGLLADPNAKPQQEAAAVQPEAAPAPAKTAAAPSSDRGGSETPPPAAKEQVLTAAPAAEPEFIMTAADPAAAPAQQPKKKGLFASLFGASPAAAAPAKPQKPQVEAKAEATQQDAAAVEEKPQALVEEDKPQTLLVKLASIEPTEQLAVSRSVTGSYDSDALPGVRKTALFEIKRKSGLDDDSDVDLHEEDELGPVRVASAAGLARLAPNGLLKQTDRVDVGCLKPKLVSTLRQLERHFGRKVVVTSGYRSPTYNRRVRGAKNSQHMYCAAADIQIAGVGKWELAAYARTLPGRGGVGTYCHTESVHVDIGPERDWNWRCRRRKA